MQNFHDYYFGLSAQERESYVQRVGTSIGYAELVAGGFRLPSLRMAIRLSRESDGQVDLDSIVRTFEESRGAIA